MAARRILWLDEVTVDLREMVGGKAANLGALLRAGFHVPPGFCVTTAAYRAFVEANGLRAGIETLARDPGEMADPYTLFARPMDEALKEEILTACHQLLDALPVGSRLAVRSSATNEDLSDASFAGQGETFLDVSLDEVVDRIRHCWASLWTARAIAYRQHKGGRAPEMAVLVQRMIPCDAGGVAFTADPLGGDTIIIEATCGLAVAVAQGTGEVTRYRVDRHSLSYSQEGGDVLAPAQVRLVAETALALEDSFGSAQDIEWGLWNGELYIFQCRPLTTGACPERSREADRFFTQVIPNDNYLWTGGYLNERFPQPVSPLGWSIVGSLTEELAFRAPLRYLGYRHLDRLPLTKLYRGHPYTNVAVFQILYKVFPDALVPDDAARYFPGGDTGLRRQAPYPCCLFDPRFLVSMLFHFIREPANWSPLHNYRHWARFALRHETAMAELAQRLESVAGRLAGISTGPATGHHRCGRSPTEPPSAVPAQPKGPPQQNPDDLWTVIETAQRWNRELLGIHRWSLMAADLTVPLLRRLVGRWVSPQRQVELSAHLLSGLPNKSLELDQALRRLTQEPTQEGANLQDFLARYGHRSFSLDIYHPTFADEPGQVLRLLEVAGQGPDPAARVAARESAEREVRAAIAARPLGRFKLLIFDRVLALARRYVALREDQRFAWQRTLALMRRAFLYIAEQLVAEGFLDRTGDIFFATLGEVRELLQSAQPQPDATPRCGRSLTKPPAGDARLEARQTIAARRAVFERLQREFELAPHLTYPAFLRGNRPLEPAPEERVEHWQGVPVSPGLVRGPARVVLSPGQFNRIAPGDILVTRSTDPGWTPIFGRLGGLIMERGGQLSHGSVIAREYGLPAVVGIPHITALLRDDDLVLLDGLTGTVVLEGSQRT